MREPMARMTAYAPSWKCAVSGKVPVRASDACALLRTSSDNGFTSGVRWDSPPRPESQPASYQLSGRSLFQGQRPLVLKSFLLEGSWRPTKDAFPRSGALPVLGYVGAERYRKREAGHTNLKPL